MRNRYIMLLPVLAAVPAMAVPTTDYDADSGVLPNVAGEIFEGGTTGAPHLMSFVDLGGGDLVLNIDSQDVNNSPYFEKSNAQSPTTWNVNRATGFSIEFRARMDSVEATEAGSFDVIFGSPDRGTSLRLTRAAAGGAATAIFKSAFNNTVLGTTGIANPDDFHTFRVDVLNDDIDLYIDNVLTIDNAQDPAASALHILRFGDGTGAGDGNYQVQFIRTYQSGIVPEPGTLAVVSLAGLFLQRRATSHGTRSLA